MYRILDKMETNRFLAYRHIGNIKSFEELPIDEETKEWTNAMETYKLNANDNGTELKVNANTIASYIDFMNKTFPIALNELKKIGILIQTWSYSNGKLNS